MDNNIFLSPVSLTSVSQGGAYVHNLFAGAFRIVPYDARQTPFHKAHSTEVAGLHDNPCGDDRFYNNLFVGRGDLSLYDRARLPVAMDGNVFLKGARPARQETSPVVSPEFDPAIRLVETKAGLHLEMKTDSAWAAGPTRSPGDHRAAWQGEHPEPAVGATRWLSPARGHRLFRRAQKRNQSASRPFREAGSGPACVEGVVSRGGVPAEQMTVDQRQQNL